MSQISNFKIKAGTMPLGFSGTWQDFLDGLEDWLEVSLGDGFSTFATGSITPNSNEGPFFKDGGTLFIWDDAQAQYVPIPLTDESRGVTIGPNAPTTTDRMLWAKTKGTGEPSEILAYHSSEWKPFGVSKAQIDNIVPRGLTCMWSGTLADLASATTGWFLADGGTYNGFKTQDLRNKFIIGAGDRYSYQDQGGFETVNLSENQMPKHNHNVSLTQAGEHKHKLFADSSSANNADELKDNKNLTASSSRTALNSPAIEFRYTINAVSSNADSGDSSLSGEHTHGASVSNAGNGDEHENRPPYYSLAYITFCGLP